MNRFKKLLSLFLAVVMIVSVTAMMAGCSGDGNKSGSDSTGSAGGSANGDTEAYTVTVRSIGRMPLKGVDVYIYSGSDMKDYGETDADGSISFNLAKDGKYTIKIDGAPKGYAVEESYSFNGTDAVITLVSSLVTDDDIANASLGLGDVMYDFTVTTTEGTKVTLSDMLKEKDMVMINFFFTTCSPCVTEFPYMHEVYLEYQDDVGIIALDSMGEDNTKIANFKAEMGLTFPMAAVPNSWAAALGIKGYPTSVFVDRYGVICLMEEGGLPSKRPFIGAFDHFTGNDYTQKVFTAIDQLVSKEKPNVSMDTSENVGAILNKGDINVTYRPETDPDDAEYSWPFVAAEKKGESCLKASNSGVVSSYAIMYADVTLKAGQAFGFDYLVSTEANMDVLYVLVDGEPIFNISGVNDPEKWEKCYPVVATEDRTYEIAFVYQKDDDGDAGDDTVYLKNFRVLDPKDIDVDTYLPRDAATTEDGFEYHYVELFFNEKDGYYHVGSKNGPLLLANLMNTSDFNEEKSVFSLIDGGNVTVDGHNYYEEIVQYCSYASNSSFSGYCTVNKELAELLMIVDQVTGFDDEDDNEWLKLCKYYQTYGKDPKPMQDPVAGLATFSAFKATEGKNVSTNCLTYDRVIMPRGLMAEFIPSKSGVYRITSRNESVQGVEGWIFDKNMKQILVYEHDERMFEGDEVSMVLYMKKGEPYYIDICFADVYETGTVYYDIEYIAAELDHFRLASPGPFTYDTNATGDAMYHTIAGGIKVILGKDGFYHEDLGKDSKGNQLYGSIVYADFTGITGIFSDPIATYTTKDENGKPIKIKGLIDKGAFDFSKTEDDQYILVYMSMNDNDPDKTRDYLKDLWGAEYEVYAEEFLVEDVLAGKYHGTGKDETEAIKKFLSKMYEGPAKERVGCVAVDAELANLLQQLMDKFTFPDVDNSWTKISYYYDYLGPNN